MFRKAIVSKLKVAVSILLALAFVAEATPLAVFAGSNGSGAGSPGGAATATTWGQAGWDSGIAIFLYRDETYILDNTELRFESDPLKRPTFNEELPQYEGFSLTKAYAQIFRRTYISWTETDVQNSLLLLGRNMWWNANNLVIGYNYATPSTNADFQAHRITFTGGAATGNGAIAYFKPLAEQEAYGSWKASDYKGNGIFKQRLIDYMKSWFAKKTTVTPHQFLENLVNNASVAEKEAASHIWSYISAGVDDLIEPETSGGPKLSPVSRWEKIFVESNAEMSWDTTYLTSGGLQVTLNGVLQDMPSWEESDAGAKQVAGFLDSLLTIALMSNYNGKSDIGGQYVNAAKEVFGDASEWATTPEQLEQEQALVIQLTKAQNWEMGGAPTITDPTDWWALWHKQKGTATIVSDFRTNPIYTKDYEIHPLLEKSEVFKAWSGSWNSVIGSNESLSRLALRLHSMQSTTGNRLTVDSPNTEVYAFGVNYGGMVNFAPTAALLGRTKGSASELINRDTPQSGGFTGTIDTIGPQFLIGMFAHNAVPNTEVNSPFTQSLAASPKSQEVEPGVTGTLGQNITVNYYFGTAFDKNTTAVNSPTETETFIGDITSELTKNKGSRLEIRTSFASRVKTYTIKHTGESGDPSYDPAKVLKNTVASGDTGWVAITDDVKTQAGNRLINTLEFASNNSDWSNISKDTLESLLKTNKMFTYIDERFKGYSWPTLPDSTQTETPSGASTKITLYKPGADYYLEVEYRADTQIRLVYADGTAQNIAYDEAHKNDTTLKNYMSRNGITDLAKVPVYLATSRSSTGAEAYSYATDTASFKYKEAPSKESKTVLNAEKAPLQYAVYSSSPEAYAELKNWGVASTNEPGDTTTLGNGRSPVDTAAGVLSASNGSTTISEDYEVMAGIPTTEKLYLAVGGSEFIVDLAVQYVLNETAVRAYKSHFDGTVCQFNYASLSGAGGDTPSDAVWKSIPQPRGNLSGLTTKVTGTPSHTGFTVTMTIGGEIKNSGQNGPTVTSDHGTSNGSSFAVTQKTGTASAQGHNGSQSNIAAPSPQNSSLGGTFTKPVTPDGKHDSPESWSWAVPNSADVQAFENGKTVALNWYNDMVAYFKATEFKSGSDQVTRRLGDGTVNNPTITDITLDPGVVGYKVLSGASGSYQITAPSGSFFNFDDGTGTKFDAVTFSMGNYKVTNPANTAASTSSTCSFKARTASYTLSDSASQTGTKYSCTHTVVGAGENAKTVCTPSTSSTSKSFAAYSKSGTITGTETDKHNIDTLLDSSHPDGALYTAFLNAYNADKGASYTAWKNSVNSSAGKTATSTCSLGAKNGEEWNAVVFSSLNDSFNEGTFTACNNTNSTHAVKSNTTTWQATLTFTVRAHVICGPCCGHNLPEINDVWQQSYNYDYIKIIGLSVLRLDQGAAADLSVDGSGLGALIGTPKLGVTRQTFYSGPAFNIAQANIFNYMGLQTDGTLDVTKATNEYFRSIAVGSGSYGQTQSSEAGRVRYWITNSDGTSKVTAKGPTFQRLIYTGNTAKTEAFANELKSEWDLNNGLYKAHDYVYYDFGKRSNICDGTSRGYQYNINKRSWLETVNGAVQGKAAYDVSWGKGFIYDGIGSGGATGTTNTTTIGMTGFSISSSYRNTAKSNNYSGIYQPSTKGYQGTGVNTASQKVSAYENAFTYKYAVTMNTLQTPVVRDWDNKQHSVAYADTRQLILNGAGSVTNGLVWPDAASGDKSPRSTAVDTYAASNSGANPYNVDEFLTAYTNVTNNSGERRAQATNEYKLMLAKRNEKVQATVISDMLFLETSRGIQPILYFYKNASAAAEVDDRIPDTRASFSQMWLTNSFTPNGWASTPSGTSKDAVSIAGFNGIISSSSDTSAKFNERDDEIPNTVITTAQVGAAEGSSGKIGSSLGAKTLHGVNINSYLTRGSPVQIVNYTASSSSSRTLLYNISPIVLSADNRAYDPGVAEVFWETIVQWKDSSNHDYYSKYPDAGVGVTQYLAPGQFVRLPALLGNYGQTARNEAVHTATSGAALLASYFIDTAGNEAIGAAAARAAQAEQYGRGFSVTGYNYDSTNKSTVNGKTYAQSYNKSADLTSAALGAAYSSSGKVGAPFILDGVTSTGFNTSTATRRIGTSGAASIARSGYIQQAAYTTGQSKSGIYALNPVIIHTPVTSRAVQIMPIAEWRDQRVSGQSSVAYVRESQSAGCPGLAELCQFSVLACKYHKDMTFLDLDFTTGSGNTVVNKALNAATAGNIILAGSFTCTATGLASGGSMRSGLSLEALGADYYSSMNYKVTATGVSYSGGVEQMLFGFEKYGITLNPSTGKLYIRVYGSVAYLEVAGTFPTNSSLTVEFGSSNASQSKVWVNGTLRTLSVVGGATASLAIGSGQIGGNFYLGAWNAASSPSYAPTANTRIKTLKLERLAGNTSHGIECISTIARHVGGNNTHIHESSHLGTGSSSAYLNGTLNDYNNGKITTDLLKERLGIPVYTALMALNRSSTLINQTVSLSTATTVKDFSYTGGMQSFTAPVSGTYTLEAWGAQGGGASPGGSTGSRGGAGGYSKGDITLSAGETIYVGIGGQGSIAGAYSAGQAEIPGVVRTFSYTGAVQTFTAPVTGTYTFEVWGAQGGGNASSLVSGYGGYATGTYALTAGQTVSVYVGGKGSLSADTESGGGWNGGGNASYKGYGGGGASDIRVGGISLSSRVIVAGGGGGQAGSIYSHNTDSGLGGYGGGTSGTSGTSYTSTSTAGSGATSTGGGPAGTNRSSSILPTAGSLGQGGNSGGYGGGAGGGGYYGGGGGGGTYSPYDDGSGGGGGSGYIGGVSSGAMQTGVHSGNGKVVITAPATPAVSSGYYGSGGGGYNGGGNGYSGSGTAAANAGAAGYGGGGATHFSKTNSVLSALNSNRTSVLLVAGGGGGSDDITGENAGQANDGSGGNGGGTAGGNAYINGVQQAGTGGTQASGHAFGQGASAVTAADTGGAGGGWYGGYATNNPNGGGGSGYIGGVTNSSMQTGVRSGNGAARISYVIPATKTYTITVPQGGEYELNAVTSLTSGNPTLTLYRGASLTPANQLAYSDDYSGLGLNSRITIRLTAGTYTIVAGSNSLGTAAYNLTATLTRSFFTYTDIMSLANISGAEAWRSIPFYLADGSRNPVWSCSGDMNKHICVDCYEESTYDKCTEPHHTGLHNEDSLCFDSCKNDALHDTNHVQDKNVNSPAAEFVSIDWDYTLYAGTVDNFRGTTASQLTSLSERTGRGYTEEEDTVRFIRGKYVRFPWYALYNGILYSPGEWIVLGDRGSYISGITSNSSGIGGNTQGVSSNSGAVWHGGQAAAYNVQNWSLYNQQIYKDLYMDFYDFYVPLANDEQSLGTCTYAVVAVNSPTEGINGKAPTTLGNANIWETNNKTRSSYKTAYGASKQFYVDLVGRIGGFVIEDVTDVKFSNTFKETRQTSDETNVTFTVNPSNLTAVNGLQGSSPANMSAAGVALKAVGDWAGFDFNADNERDFTITIHGSWLKACELEVMVADAHNGDYILRISDLTILENKDNVLSVYFSVKPTEASAIIKPRLRLLDGGIDGALVSSMVLGYGGSGYSHGLSQSVDQTKQNYYVTDVTDVRGIYLGTTKTLTGSTETWKHWGTYGISAKNNWVELEAKTQLRDANNISGRTTPANGTRAINTYGTRPWVEINDPLYKAWSSAGGRALLGPLTSAHNAIAQYRTAENQLSVGSSVLYDVTTLGNYYGKDSTLQIIPSYYAIDLTKRNPDGSVVLTPVDVYQLSGSGEYTEVNIFGAPYGGFTNEQLDSFNRYRLSVNWGNEAVGQYNRRNVTAREYSAAQEYRDVFREVLTDASSTSGSGPGTGAFAGFGASWREIPGGIVPVGGAQLVSQGYNTQTYIGSHMTYGVAKDGGAFSGTSGTDHPRYLYWEIAAQRWHSTIGLPSDAVFVPLELNSGRYSHVSKSEIRTKMLDIETTLVISYLDITAFGDVWTLQYGTSGVERRLTIGGEEYLLPRSGPPGAGTADVYPGGTATPGLPTTNPGIPFVVFGGSKVPDMAEIIKVN